MKVHFITSRQSINQDIVILKKIMSAIENSGSELVLKWIERAYARQKTADSTADWKAIFKMNLETIAKSDVVIAETSYENFGVGYQVAMAVQQKKPILLLRHAAADKNAFVTGIEDGWVQHEEYEDEANVEEKVKKFLDDNNITAKDMRFNFFIDRQIYNYLRWASYKSGKTKAEVLRELVQREIEEKNY